MSNLDFNSVQRLAIKRQGILLEDLRIYTYEDFVRCYLVEEIALYNFQCRIDHQYELIEQLDDEIQQIHVYGISQVEAGDDPLLSFYLYPIEDCYAPTMFSEYLKQLYRSLNHANLSFDSYRSAVNEVKLSQQSSAQLRSHRPPNLERRKQFIRSLEHGDALRSKQERLEAKLNANIDRALQNRHRFVQEVKTNATQRLAVFETHGADLKIQTQKMVNALDQQRAQQSTEFQVSQFVLSSASLPSAPASSRQKLREQRSQETARFSLNSSMSKHRGTVQDSPASAQTPTFCSDQNGITNVTEQVSSALMKGVQQKKQHPLRSPFTSSLMIAKQDQLYHQRVSRPLTASERKVWNSQRKMEDLLLYQVEYDKEHERKEMESFLRKQAQEETLQRAASAFSAVRSHAIDALHEGRNAASFSALKPQLLSRMQLKSQPERLASTPELMRMSARHKQQISKLRSEIGGARPNSEMQRQLKAQLAQLLAQ